MTEPINVEKIATLARLKLEKNEEADFQKKFNEILGYVGSISEAKLESEELAKDESMQQIYHEDKAVNSDVSPSQFSNFIENQFFKVPRVIE